MNRTTRATRAPTIFGAILMAIGALLYFVDLYDTGRNLHWFLIPSVLLLGIGAIFAAAGLQGDSSDRTEG